jgi:hypothetical protein
MPAAMLPVVSIAISTSALGGFAGTVTVFVSVVPVPGLSVKLALAGERLAPVAAVSTIASTAAATNAVETPKNFLVIVFPLSDAAGTVTADRVIVHEQGNCKSK